jgi:hypothetical protein
MLDDYVTTHFVQYWQSLLSVLFDLPQEKAVIAFESR